MAQNKKVPSVFLISLVTGGLMTGCASSRNQTKVRQTSDTSTTQAMNQAESFDAGAVPSDSPLAPLRDSASIVSHIEFNQGQKTLSPEATAELNRALSEARTQGEVEGVDIMVWSDHEVNAKPPRKQTRSQVEIARQRGENIEKYVDRMEPLAFVQVHNMATRPDALMNYLNAQGEVTKGKLAQAGIAADSEADEVKQLSSSAIILIKMK